jgi:hypothetical protein
VEQPSGNQQQFTSAFEGAFAGLQVELEEAWAGQLAWPLRVAAAVGAGLRFAAADPGAAQTLTSEALAAGPEGIARHERLISYLRAGLALGRRARPENERLPDITEHAMASGVVMLVAQRVDQGRAAELPALVPEAIQFVLTPYLGAEEARRVAARFGAEECLG